MCKINESSAVRAHLDVFFFFPLGSNEVILRLNYSYKTKDVSDSFFQIAEDSFAGFSKAAEPGWLVDSQTHSRLNPWYHVQYCCASLPPGLREIIWGSICVCRAANGERTRHQHIPWNHILLILTHITWGCRRSQNVSCFYVPWWKWRRWYANIRARRVCQGCCSVVVCRHV